MNYAMLFSCLYFNLYLLYYIIAFRALLDNYEADTRQPEKVTSEEECENCCFLDAVMETPVMKTTHEFLVSEGKAPADVTEFKDLLCSIWFKLYKRTGRDRFVVSLISIIANRLYNALMLF